MSEKTNKITEVSVPLVKIGCDMSALSSTIHNYRRQAYKIVGFGTNEVYKEITNLCDAIYTEDNLKEETEPIVVLALSRDTKLIKKTVEKFLKADHCHIIYLYPEMSIEYIKC